MATSKKTSKSSKPTKPSGTLMSMRSSFQKAVGTGPHAKKATKEKWTFQQVFLLVAGIAAVIAVFYALSRR